MNIAQQMTELKNSRQLAVNQQLNDKADKLLIEIERLANEGIGTIEIYLNSQANTLTRVRPDHAAQLAAIFTAKGFATDVNGFLIAIHW